jgi:RNA polymerase sigma-70 factor, ECF subfamily
MPAPQEMMLAVEIGLDEIRADDDAIARMQRGSMDAAGEVMVQYQQRLYRFLIRMVQEPAAAEDLFQQTWIRVMQKVGSYDVRRSFDSWLFSVAHNLAIDHLRKKRSVSLDDDDGEAPLQWLAGAGPDPLEQVLSQERGVMLAMVIARLPAIHREVLSLRFEEDLKLEEIAEVIGVPVSTVKSRLSRALESLRRKMGERA